MNKFFRLLVSASICIVSPSVFADPPMPPFYSAVMKMAPDGKLGQVIKKEKIDTSVKGAQAAYPNLQLSDVLTDEGAKVVDKLSRNKCMHVLADTFSYAYGDQYKSLLKTEPSNSLAWVKAFVDGSVKPVKPTAPVVIYWGTKDTAVPPVMHELYQKQMCAMGANIGRVQLPGEQTHFSTPGVSAPMYLEWVKDRIAGKPLANACPQN